MIQFQQIKYTICIRVANPCKLNPNNAVTDELILRQI